MDIYQQIKDSTDLDFLKELKSLVNIDINNIGSDSDIIKKMKANMRNTLVKDMEKKQLSGLMDIKKKIEKRILKLQNNGKK